MSENKDSGRVLQEVAATLEALEKDCGLDLNAKQRNLIAELSRFQLNRMVESYAACGRHLLERGKKISTFGLSHVYANDDLERTIDSHTRQWVDSPPRPLSDIVAQLNLIHRDLASSLPERTVYRRRIFEESGLADPNPTDLAYFVAENCHGNMLIENVFTMASLFCVNVFRQPRMLDCLSLFLFRYPRPRAMEGLRVHSGETFESILLRGGFDISDGVKKIDIYKNKAKLLLKHWLSSHGADLPLSESWFSRFLPRPNMTRYGHDVVPLLEDGGGSWQHSALIRMFEDREAQGPIDVATMVSILDEELARATPAIRPPNTDVTRSDKNRTVNLGAREFSAVVRRFLSVISIVGRGSPATRAVVRDDEDSVVVELLVGDSPLGRSAVATLCLPFSHVEGASPLATDPWFCAALDRLRDLGASPSVRGCDDSMTTIHVKLPTLF